MLALTQSETFIIGPVAQVLGFIMEGIYWCLDKLSIANIGLCIILFTIIVYLLMLPLTIKQQKFSKMSAIMNPEIKAIQNKYKDKKDQQSMMQQNEEIQMVYQKYGVSASGGCLQMLIQLPILFALYQVIMKIPAYVCHISNSLYSKYEVVVNAVKIAGSKSYTLTEIVNKSGIKVGSFKNSEVNNKIIDAMCQLSSGQLNGIVDNLSRDIDRCQSIVDVTTSISAGMPTGIEKVSEFTSVCNDIIVNNQDKIGSITDQLSDVAHNVKEIVNVNGFIFDGFSLVDSPSEIISSVMETGLKGVGIGMLILALAIPILAGLTQFLNTKLMPQNNTGNDEGTMASSLKTMNMVMPIMSVIFCFTFASGLGLYWVIGAVVRCVQQVIINKKLSKIDVNELIKKNIEKINEKRAKKGLPPQRISSAAKQNTKTIDRGSDERKKANQEKAKASSEFYKNNSTAKQGSLKSKANMVKQFNEKNKK